MNMKESLSVKIAHRHLTSLGTTFFTNQMISSMKPAVHIPKRFSKKIRSNSVLLRDVDNDNYLQPQEADEEPIPTPKEIISIPPLVKEHQAISTMKPELA